MSTIPSSQRPATAASRPTPHILVRCTAVAVAIAALLTGLTVTAGTAEAAPAAGYYETPCVIPALTGDGLDGGGCDVRGATRWVTLNPPFRTALPDQILEAIRDCAVWGAYGFAEKWGDVQSAPPQYRVGIGAAYLFLGCVEGVATP